jgi:hypothetical protein
MERTLRLKFSFYKYSAVGLFAVLISFNSFAQDYGKSYVNISKGTSGSTIEPGDTLEIRATFVVRSGTFTQCAFTDVVPANTTYVPGTLRVLTNEGKIFRQWTDAASDDPGTISGSNITIYLGTGATSSSGGSINNTDKPSFYHGSCIMVASYRIVVNAVPYGTKIPIGQGNLTYTSGSTVNITFPQDTIMVYQNYGICSNTVGANAILSEFGGTFGSGNIKDRGASTSVPSNYTYAAFTSGGNMPNDYYYGVSNNTSGGTTTATGYSTSNTWAVPDNSQTPSHRIFRVWDIIGDHTGASNPLLGNPATDDNAGASGGYMLAINASYRTDTAFLDTVINLCPNTYYQYVAWFRNICSKCGCDSNGTGATGGSTYIPTGPGDSSGVHPNLTFNVNGADYYTTGDILHTGQWIQKGFIYKTGPTETTMIINIRNNAPGGGGNDWVIDDIDVATCSPNIALTPDKPDTLCQGADDTVRFKVTSYFNNYTEWEIEQSFDNGVTWALAGTDTTGAASTGSATPVFDSTINQYSYTISRYYRLDNVHTFVEYRIVIASTVANLNNANCSFPANTPKAIYAVNCLSILPVSIIYFNGQLSNGLANLKWTTTNETAGIQYVIERSADQINFETVGVVSASSLEGSGSTYNFIDPKPVSSVVYYRIRITNGINQKLSTVVMLSSSEIDFGVRSLINPFSSEISFEMTAPDNNIAIITLADMYGRTIKQEKQNVSQGLNNVNIYDLSLLPTAAYTLKIQYADKIVVRQVMKK